MTGSRILTLGIKLKQLQSCHKFIFNRNLSSTGVLNNFLVNDPKYSFLKELGLEEVNNGVYDGTWRGSGEVCTQN